MSATIYSFDGCGLQCPHVLLKLQRFVRSLPDESVVAISVDDPIAPGDIKAWSKVHGHAILNESQHESVFKLTVKTALAVPSRRGISP